MTTQSVYAWSVGAFCILDVIVIELILKSIRCQIGNVWSSFKKNKKIKLQVIIHYDGIFMTQYVKMTTKSLKNLWKTEDRLVHPSPNKFFSLPTNLPMTGSLLWCFGIDISTEFYTLAGLLYFFSEFLNLIQTTSSCFFLFCLLERWNASIPVQPRNVPGKQGQTLKAFTVEDIRNWRLTVNAKLFLSLQSWIRHHC